ncbi:MAG: glycosyltransferase family 4 protein, partial [Fimbriimonadaceae bacterium]
MPRQCGIATFTADLALALSSVNQGLTIDSVAMSDRDDYVYPEQVCYEIPDSIHAAYGLAATHINRHGYDILSVQHEYGIFGGEAGSYLMSLVREAKMPIVTTLHTVLQKPSFAQKEVLDELLQLSERVVVMSRKAVGFLMEIHDVPVEKIDLIPHGIPKIEANPTRSFRASLGIDGPMILTFGLLSPDKGIQFVIEAMPQIVQAHPGATYVVVGATHPHVRASAGEVYRESLVKLAADLGVSHNVRFVDRFVSLDELVEYLAAMDMYVTPYLNPQQITSGTLAYSIGAGKAVISTPYWYAEELLSDGRGVLVPFRDAGAIADAVLGIQSEPESRLEMGRKAAEYGQNMLWPEVGRSYLSTFNRAKRESAERLRVIVGAQRIEVTAPLPDLRLNHLFDLSDDTGILQHATFSIPNRSEGYCVDDNARALLLTTYVDSPDVALLQSRYLSFVMDAFNPANGRFRNFMSYGRAWLEEAGSEDSHGRSLWALGATANRSRDRGRREVAKQLFERGAPAMSEMTSPRAWAYGILGAAEYLHSFPHESSGRSILQLLANRLFARFEGNHSEEWPWPEQSLTYANARLSQALIVASEQMDNRMMSDMGLKSLAWLMGQQTGAGGVFAPIGANGFYARGEERAMFDQQPVEAAASVSACLSAYRFTGRTHWLDEAHRSFR